MHHHLNVSPFLPPPHLSPSLETRGGGLLFLVFLMLSLTRQTDLEPTIFSERAEGSTKEGSRIFFCVRGCRMRPEASKSACFATTFVFHPVSTRLELCSRQSCECTKNFKWKPVSCLHLRIVFFSARFSFFPSPYLRLRFDWERQREGGRLVGGERGGEGGIRASPPPPPLPSPPSPGGPKKREGEEEGRRGRDTNEIMYS